MQVQNTAPCQSKNRSHSEVIAASQRSHSMPAGDLQIGKIEHFAAPKKMNYVFFSSTKWRFLAKLQPKYSLWCYPPLQGLTSCKTARRIICRQSFFGLTQGKTLHRRYQNAFRWNIYIESCLMRQLMQPSASSCVSPVFLQCGSSELLCDDWAHNGLASESLRLII